MPLLSGMLRALLLLALLLPPLIGRASESASVESPRAVVTLLADRAAIAPGEPFRLMLRQRLAPGWHTYWRNAGDAGAPPEITIEWPEGWAAGELQFPAPSRIAFGPLMNFGYTGTADFLLSVTPPASLKPGDYVTITADATWLVCADVCIPEEGRFTLGLDVAQTARPAHAAAFQAAEAALPRAAPFQASFGFAGTRGALTIRSPSFTAGAVRAAEFFPDAQNVIENAPEQRLAAREGEITLMLARAAADPPAPLTGVLTITDAAGVRGAYLVAAEPGGPLPGNPLPLWQVLAFAALGGLILNLMPCVFPILAMKAMAMARLGGAGRGAIRAEAAGYTLGVVLSFLALGGLMLGLRAAGGGAGWGFQFTYPAFVAGMAWLMLAVGLNLSGVFQLGGPAGMGQGLAGQGGPLGSFFTGILAVVVATPCTAPFMATAIGAALVLPPSATLAIFGAMGLGLAAPYAMLGLFPGAGRFLPRPGVWMERFRQFLAFPMYGAAAWLVWVLAQQAGPDGVLTVLVGAVLIALAAWAWGVAQHSGRTPRRLGEALALAAVLAALALLPLLGSAPPASAAPGQGEAWSATRLAELRAEGRPVFVNLTAAWCISCKVNERVAIGTEATQRAFGAAGIVQLTGDWTRGDPAITALLREHGRDGVPLYLLYPAGGGAPAILPQILTEGMLLQALRG
ncbi:protein-disulfide reductase DsbD domain-containing protein [Sediminicoccus sp. KRV36]|uniref:protein-disulfide reductase DsbD family protein n=1 Tax=Sediminicoccus sp. KRV36 TaxID=3133721 RepID=UPI00200C5B21|nr:protein-disulfide reductase DsbD domain-containing protein [Sediminicoccus rosea]UPY38116.1 thioredoxin family protein [Sediminicoccus rosea]